MQAREWVTTLLDVLGLLLFSAGVAAAFEPVLGWAALAVAGVIVLAGSWVAVNGLPSWRRQR